MDTNRSDIEVQARVTKSIIARDRMSLQIQRGAIALILVITFCLSVQAVQDGVSVWKVLIMLLLILLVIGTTVMDERKIRKLREDIQKTLRELKGLKNRR